MVQAHRSRSAVAALLLFAAAAARAEGPAPVALPKDFRSWTHVRSMVVTDPDEGMYGFHNVYANPAALKALRSEKTPVVYPDGATFVVSIFEVKQEKGLVVAGAKQRDVMQVKDAKAKATSGWRFASFDPSGKPIAIDAASCAACHTQAAATDMVFTRYTR
jgi:cytochrome c553